jgi:rubrerythrin
MGQPAIREKIIRKKIIDRRFIRMFNLHRKDRVSPAGNSSWPVTGRINYGPRAGRKKMNQEEFKKIISNAINQEVEAFHYYSSVSDQAKDAGIKKLFKDLAAEEAGHKRTLESFLKREPHKMHFAESRDYKITDALAAPPLTTDLKPVDGIVIAIKKELEAMQMYTQLAFVSTDPEQKNIFLELVSMERGHKSKLEDIYTNMALPEVW